MGNLKPINETLGIMESIAIPISLLDFWVHRCLLPLIKRLIETDATNLYDLLHVYRTSPLSWYFSCSISVALSYIIPEDSGL